MAAAEEIRKAEEARMDRVEAEHEGGHLLEGVDALLGHGAVGGLAVGEGQEAMFGVLDYAPDMLPKDRPRYLMGVGKPDDLVGAVERGIDMFDCVLPTRSGRNGQAFTWNGPLNLRNARFAEDTGPLDDRSDLYNTIDAFIPALTPDDYEIDEKQRSANFAADPTSPFASRTWRPSR